MNTTKQQNEEAKEKTKEQELVDIAAQEKTSELAILKESLDQARAEAGQYYDQLVRLKADFENFRKRTEKEKTDCRRWGKEEVILRLVSLMDVMEQAEAAAHKTADLKSVVAGLDMLYKEFKRLLREEGLEEITAREGEKFNPDIHEAVETVDQEGEEGRILAVLQRGYRFQGALMRPARVKVSQKPKAQETGSGKQEGKSTHD
jgi:molecular chaperone GrpE